MFHLDREQESSFLCHALLKEAARNPSHFGSFMGREDEVSLIAKFVSIAQLKADAVPGK